MVLLFFSVQLAKKARLPKVTGQRSGRGRSEVALAHIEGRQEASVTERSQGDGGLSAMLALWSQLGAEQQMGLLIGARAKARRNAVDKQDGQQRASAMASQGADIRANALDPTAADAAHDLQGIAAGMAAKGLLIRTGKR
jgi:hypothetical protein